MGGPWTGVPSNLDPSHPSQLSYSHKALYPTTLVLLRRPGTHDAHAHAHAHALILTHYEEYSASRARISIGYRLAITHRFVQDEGNDIAHEMTMRCVDVLSSQALHTKVAQVVGPTARDE